MENAIQFAAMWFLAFMAAVEIQPVMLPADLAKASGSIAKAVRKYG